MTGHTTRPAVAPAVHTVLLYPGDTLWALAHHYRTTVAALQRANHLGVSYLWGGTGSGGYDCSGLIRAACGFARGAGFGGSSRLGVPYGANPSRSRIES
ncbi:LysM peptidoglycan-binding domain-containing protein [Streptomyces sp. NPDC048277]|uniref:LysM peptidoglycan-binding domain-containing protein n=1 Tax=Streptomyces sp. NPDC048277 TaxID=3155027 RepID=UPI0033E5A6BE